MSEFELVVLGSGTGNIVASAAAFRDAVDVVPSGIRRAGASTSPATRSTHDNG